jgi:hypothetical protein
VGHLASNGLFEKALVLLARRVIRSHIRLCGERQTGRGMKIAWSHQHGTPRWQLNPAGAADSCLRAGKRANSERGSGKLPKNLTAADHRHVALAKIVKDFTKQSVVLAVSLRLAAAAAIHRDLFGNLWQNPVFLGNRSRRHLVEADNSENSCEWFLTLERLH